MKKNQTRTRIASDNPLSDPDKTLRMVGLLFGADGKPSPVLQKSVTHFKDRFRELVRNLWSGAGVKPSSKTETTPSGSRVLLTARVPGAGGVAATLSFKRLLTPTMSVQADFRLADPAWGLGSNWTSELRKDRGSVISAEATEVQGDLVITAAMLFHHPEDEVYVEAARKATTHDPLPSGDQTVDLRDGVLVLQGQVFRVMDTSTVMYDGGRPWHAGVMIRFADKYDPLGWQVAEAAQSRGATRAQIIQLAERGGATVIALEERVGKDVLDPASTARVPRADWMRSILTAHMERAYGRVRQEQAGGQLAVNMDGIQVRVQPYFDPLDRLAGLPQIHVSTSIGATFSPTSHVNIAPVRAYDLLNPADLKEYEALVLRKLDDAISRSLNNMY